VPVRLSARDVRSIVAGARRAARRLREVCGLLVDHGGLVRLVPTPNRSKEPCSFWIGRQDWRRVEKAAVTLGSRVVGTFHSHVASHPAPGPGDIRGAIGGQIMIIIDSINGEIRAWRIRRRRAFPMKHTVVRLPPGRSGA